MTLLDNYLLVNLPAIIYKYINAYMFIHANIYCVYIYLIYLCYIYADGCMYLSVITYM